MTYFKEAPGGLPGDSGRSSGGLDRAPESHSRHKVAASYVEDYVI